MARLQTRLTVFTAVVITAVSGVVGGVAVANSSLQEQRQLDDSLSAAAGAVSKAVVDPLATALLAAEQSPVELTVALFDINGDLTTIAGDSVVLGAAPKLSVLESGVSRSVDVAGDYRLRTVSLSDNEYVLFAVNTDRIEANRTAAIQLLLLFMVIANSLGLLVIWLFFRSGFISDFRTQRDEMQRFLGDASHELRTPLTVIRGYLELLGGGKMQPEQQERAVSRMLTESNRMQNLITDLLQLAELGEKGSIEGAPVVLSELVADAAADLVTLETERAVTVDVADEVVVSGSEDLLRQLIANLISNIRRHTADTDAVSISLDASGRSAVLVIEDGGPGLPAEFYADRVKHFKRFDESRSRESGGSGLGMSIIAAIVERHHGRLELSKSSLGGLRVEIRLPLA